MVNNGFTVKDGEEYLASKWSNRTIQISVYAAVVFYIVANPAVFKFMKSFLPSKVTEVNQLLLHAVLFAVLMYFGTTLMMDPLLKKVGLV
jgi:hypothetical protein